MCRKYLTRGTARGEVWSHARTVVRECCKGDDESQWERVKFDPRHPKKIAGQISAFPIDFAGRPYNTLTLACERVI